MPQIFISYRRSETGYVATMLANELKDEFGENSVFMDVDNIPLGVDFRDHIGSAVSECQVLLALVGDNWLTSALPDGTRRIDAPDDFVRVEIEAALKRNIPVVPILTGNATIPSERELPPSIRELAFRNAAELRAGRELRAEFQGLLDQLRSILASTGPAQLDASRQPRRSVHPHRLSKRPLVIGAISLTAIVAACAIYFAMKPPDRSGRTRQPMHEVILQTANSAISLYKEPNENSEKTGSLRRGSIALVVDTHHSPDGHEWTKILINPGWVAGRNLADPNYLMISPVNTSKLLAGHPAIVNYSGTDGLNLRESPNLQSRVIAILLNDTRVTIISDSLRTSEYEWWQVEVPPAWISNDGVSMENRQ